MPHIRELPTNTEYFVEDGVTVQWDDETNIAQIVESNRVNPKRIRVSPDGIKKLINVLEDIDGFMEIVIANKTKNETDEQTND